MLIVVAWVVLALGLSIILGTIFRSRIPRDL